MKLLILCFSILYANYLSRNITKREFDSPCPSTECWIWNESSGRCQLKLRWKFTKLTVKLQQNFFLEFPFYRMLSFKNQWHVTLTLYYKKC